MYKVLKYLGINLDDYITDEDLVIYVADEGYKNLTQLLSGDHKVWKLIKQWGLEKYLFPQL